MSGSPLMDVTPEDKVVPTIDVEGDSEQPPLLTRPTVDPETRFNRKMAEAASDAAR